jgi:hypothetical protein
MRNPRFQRKEEIMKSYSVTYARDVPHYASAEVFAENDAGAIKAAIYFDVRPLKFHPNDDEGVCLRIIQIDDEHGDAVSEEDIPLDDLFHYSGGEKARRVCDAAKDLLCAIETLITKADDLTAAIEGVTNQFEPEVAALCAAAGAAEKIAQAARGRTGETNGAGEQDGDCQDGRFSLQLPVA